MQVQLRLALTALQRNKQNIFLASFRRAQIQGASGHGLVSGGRGMLNLFGGCFGDLPLALRAINIKQYRYGFGVSLLPLKNVNASLSALKQLPNVNPQGGVSLTTLGAWGSKFDHRERFHRNFFHQNFFLSPRTSHFFSLTRPVLGVLWGSYAPAAGCLLFSIWAITFWVFLSPLNSGGSFYRAFNQLGAFGESAVSGGGAGLVLLSAFVDFLGGPKPKYWGDLSSLDPEDLTYRHRMKCLVGAAYADFLVYQPLYWASTQQVFFSFYVIQGDHLFTLVGLIGLFG
jgi:hypothetical protein